MARYSSFTDALMGVNRSKGADNPPNRTRTTMERAGGGGESPHRKKLTGKSHMPGKAGKDGHGSAAGGRSHIAAKAKKR